MIRYILLTLCLLVSFAYCQQINESDLIQRQHVEQQFKVTAYPYSSFDLVVLKIQCPTESLVEIDVFTITGKIVYATRLYLDDSVATHSIEIGDYTPGNYIYEVKCSEIIRCGKFIKQ